MSVNYYEIADQLSKLLEHNPEEAIKVARTLSLEDVNCANLCAFTFIEGGISTKSKIVIQEGVDLLRRVYNEHPLLHIKYNLANGLAGLLSFSLCNLPWLAYQEKTREKRTEIRQLFWDVGNSNKSDSELRTQALTNLANQFTSSYRLSEAHDIRLEALKIDPKNGAVAGLASKELIWLYEQGICSEITHTEAVMLAKIAKDNPEKLKAYVGVQNAKTILKFADKLPDPTVRSKHQDPFIAWVEAERLTLSPTVELVEPSLGQIDWLTLPPILASNTSAKVPAIFAMFNTLKSDYLIARDIVWQVVSNKPWPKNESYADTLDSAVYGTAISAITLAHRSALDILDKVAIAANHYFEFGQDEKRLNFSNLWRGKEKIGGTFELQPKVEEVINSYAPSLYGLVELSDDYQRPTVTTPRVALSAEIKTTAAPLNPFAIRRQRPVKQQPSFSVL